MYVGDVTLNETDIRFINAELESKGLDKTIDGCLKHLDSSYTTPDGFRPFQTDSFIFKWNVAAIKWILTNVQMKDDKRKAIIKQTGDMIQKSKEYEVENSPVDYSIKKRKTRTTKKKVIAKDLFDK